MKKLIFVFSFFLAASAFAIFIPLQKDGSIRFGGPAEVAVPMATDSTSGDRRPAAQDTPDGGYIQPPGQPVYYEPGTQQPPPRQPAPQYPSGDEGGYGGQYSCLRQGYINAGYKNTSAKFIDMVAVRMKGHHDNSRKFFTNSQKRFNDSIRASIFALSALGTCNTNRYGYASGEQSQAEALLATPKLQLDDATYQGIFQIPQNRTFPKNFNTSPYNPEGVRHIRDYFKSYARNTRVHQCVRPLQSAVAVADLCRAMFTACARVGIKVSGKNDCAEVVNPRQENNPRVRPTPNPQPDPTPTPNPQPDPTPTPNPQPDPTPTPTPDPTPQGETPNGENSDHGYGNDGSNNGGGQGDGPPGGY